MTIEDLIAALEALIAVYRKRHRPPPRAVRDLTAAVKRNGNMATATLTWTNPTTRVDGSPLAASDIAHVEIFDMTTSGSTSFGFGTSPFTTPVLNVGDHAFTVVVTDTTGHSSSASNVASVTVSATLASPAPVSDLAAVLNS
jgi:hypothetical protein